MERHTRRITAVCWKKTGCRDAVSDLVQETFLRAYRGLASLKDPNSFSSWLTGIAIRVCLEWFKSPARRQHQLSVVTERGQPVERPDDPETQPDQQVQRADEYANLYAVVDALPARLREMVLLFHLEGLSYKQIAEQLHVTTATVNARLVKARALMRRKLKATEPEEQP